MVDESLPTPRTAQRDPNAAFDPMFRPGATIVRTTPNDSGLAVAADAVSRGNALILVPTLHQRSELVRELRSLGIDVAGYPEQWARSAGGYATVGTRLAAWAPIPDLASIVVIDEHDGAYKEERTPAWNARDVAVERARRAGIPCVLQSPSPSLEALETADRRLSPERSVERESWPVVDVVDLRKVDRPGLLTDPIVPLLREEETVACVLNRKGRSRMLSCASCDALATCDACGVAVHQPDDTTLACASCDTTRPVVCSNCGATRFKMIRPGISRLAEDLRALAKRDVQEITAETPARDLARGGLFIGTEALLRRIPHADAVIFLDFDQELAVPRSRAAEDAFALLALAARRVGPRAGGGRIVVQTRTPDDDVVQAALHGDPKRVAESQRDVRRVFAQPPYGAWAAISGTGAATFIDRLRELDTDDVLRIAQLGDRWRVSADGHEPLLALVNAVERPPERIRVEIDPLDL
jgi:primosomal protein N' (replication factor Y)